MPEHTSLDEAAHLIQVALTTDPALTLIQRLHRLVRHGFRPWLGYDTESGDDQTIHLRRKAEIATLHPDATLTLDPNTGPSTTIPGTDPAAFDAQFPPNTPNKRNLTRRLYEIGL